MQGFNKYFPPDFDPRKTETLNEYRGVHALGKRAKDIDKGILVVRFELPFNIWCGSCNAHLGAGVRYNAQKIKVGNYYSTPIYGFRCKCHLCSGWFEIRTDPQNARYVVHEGARAQVQDWDPEENGGFAVHDTEAPSATDKPQDAFAHLEKQVVQKHTFATKSERLTELTDLSDRLHADPYANSQRLRRHFRKEKKEENELLRQDADLKQKYGLGERIKLERLDPAAQEKEQQMWGRLSELKSSRPTIAAIVPDLAKVVKANTHRRYDPFDDKDGHTNFTKSGLGKGLGLGIKPKGKGKGKGRALDEHDFPPSHIAKRRRRSVSQSDEDEMRNDEEKGIAKVTGQSSTPSPSCSRPPTSVDANIQAGPTAIGKFSTELLEYGSDDQTESDSPADG
ncbi:hypothetical protein QFC19_000579 [Naganishia cerealis]|uniref:Uncharacterized protein n=1 Tax=Naganishia cerealis TaxID=610337 RepID=A0ACC2WPU7_9TREE|nr:hypothetical protein QFC19_000579 [Naganishia cerealis]